MLYAVPRLSCHLPLTWFMWSLLNSSWLREQVSCQEWKIWSWINEVGGTPQLRMPLFPTTACCRVWGPIGCDGACGGRWTSWLLWPDPSGDFSLLRLVLCLFFLKRCSSQLFISHLCFLSFSISTYIANLHHQSFPFLKVSQKRDWSDPSCSWQIPVERDPKIGRELGIWYLGLAKTVFYSSCVVLTVFTHKQTEKMCYVTRLPPLKFVLLAHLLFHAPWLLELLCLS